MIAYNIAAVGERIIKAAKKVNRDPAGITLVCVTKGRPAEQIKEAVSSGILDIGENRVQEAAEKYGALRNLKWHLVGHLQTNKARDAVRIFDLIHSVDSLRLAQEIDKQAAKIKKVQDILIEVKTSAEETKFGVSPEKLTGLVKDILSLQNVKLSGLMTIAPIVKDQEEARPYFAKLRQLQGEVNNFLATGNWELATELSMGMTQDFEVAIEEGSTMVRIGTAIFEGMKT